MPAPSGFGDASHTKLNCTRSIAAHTSFIRAELSWATRFPRRGCDTVTALCRFTARGTSSRLPHQMCARFARGADPSALLRASCVRPYMIFATLLSDHHTLSLHACLESRFVISVSHKLEGGSYVHR